MIPSPSYLNRKKRLASRPLRPICAYAIGCCGLSHLLRNMNGLDHFRAQHLLLAEEQVLDEINSHIVIGRQVDADVSRKKIVYFSLAPVFGSKFFR